MIKAAVLFADGTEEIEALTPVDVLKRAGACCDIVSVSGKTPIGSHGVKIFADITVNEANFSEYDVVVIPGGMPGARNISKDKVAVLGIKNAIESGKLVAAICASPAVVLAENRLIDGYKATCYPAESFINSLGENYTGKRVEVFKNLITGDGPRSAMDFALAICENLNIVPKF